MQTIPVFIIFILTEILILIGCWFLILYFHCKNINRNNLRYREFGGYFRHFLDQAGWHSEQIFTISILFFLIISTVGIIVSLYVFNSVITITVMSLWRKIIFTIFPLLLAVLIPYFVWRHFMQNFRRKIRKEVSYVINFIIIYLEAGYTIEQALAHIVPMLSQYHYTFAKELATTLNELRFLGDRPKAWQNLLDRINMDEWLFFIQLIKHEELYEPHTIQSLVRACPN